ncbi:MAG TPA: PilZ domain-containing protein [Myxococcales bacterium]|jgi:hypothetical protein
MDRTTAMMRYTFDSTVQLARHLHVVDNQALLFLRESKGMQKRVLLELEVREPSQKTVVRGEVVARAEGQLPGSWFQFADTRLARKLQEGNFKLRDRRLSADQLLQIKTPSGSLVVQLLDIGAGGLRVRCARGLGVGEMVDARLLGAPVAHADLGCARVLRVQGQEAGLRFANRGSAPVLRLLTRLREEWDKAVQLEHAKECCKHGIPIEPSLPKLRKQDVL